MKRVNFHPQVKVRRFKRDDTDIQNSWYNHEDYSSFMSDNKRIVKKLRKKSKLQPTQEGTKSSESHDFAFLCKDVDQETDECTRGLELKSLFMRRANRRPGGAVDIVLTLQAMQRYRGAWEPRYLAKIYAAYTKESTKEAMLLGFKDAEFVRDNV